MKTNNQAGPGLYGLGLYEMELYEKMEELGMLASEKSKVLYDIASTNRQTLEHILAFHVGTMHDKERELLSLQEFVEVKENGRDSIEDLKVLEFQKTIAEHYKTVSDTVFNFVKEQELKFDQILLSLKEKELTHNKKIEKVDTLKDDSIANRARDLVEKQSLNKQKTAGMSM